MTVKDALKIRFDFMMKYYETTKEKYPQIPWNADINEKIYIGDKSSSGWIGWRPLEKNEVTSFSEIEKELDVSIHKDVKEYYNSFWFLNLTVPYKKKNYIMKYVAPGRELFGLQRQWLECKNFFKNELYLTLGQESNGGSDLLINNVTGEIYSFFHNNGKLEYIAKDIAEFLLLPLNGKY